jgi:hypothetical protein
MTVNDDSGSHTTPSILACSKHDFPRASTERGMQTDFKVHFSKLESSIVLRCDSSSNPTASSHSQ